MQQLLDGAPGFVFTPVGRPAVNHDLGRQPWTFGPPDGTPVVFGTDIARIAGRPHSRRCTCLSNRRPPEAQQIEKATGRAPSHSAEQIGVQS